MGSMVILAMNPVLVSHCDRFFRSHGEVAARVLVFDLADSGVEVAGSVAGTVVG